MNVVLDTNIIVKDFNFRKTAAKILLEQAKNGMLNVHVPEVVLDEAANIFRQRIEQAQKNITSEISTIRTFTGDALSSPLSDGFAVHAAKTYRKRIEELFAEHQVKIIPYPKTDHKYLAHKAMHKKKPFSANEKGYRDNLIWENIKSLLSASDEEIAASPELVFVTDNYTDFMSGDGLHEDLVAELEEQNLQSETIVVYRDIQDFSDQYMKLFLTQETDFKIRLDNNNFWDFELKTIITEYLDKEYVRHNLSDFESLAPGEYADDEREITAYHEDFEIKKLNVKKLSADEYVVDLRIDLDTDLEFFVDKSEYYSADEVSYGVIDYDWNDYVMLVSATETISFAVNLIINSKLECQSIDMTKIEED